jgi:hypothetical protein
VEHRGRQLGVVLAAFVELQIPVAQLAVDEVIEPQGGLGEVEGGEVRAELRLGLLQAAEDPAVVDRRGPRLGLGRGDDVAQHVARGVEELVGQRLALADLLGGVAHVLGARHGQQPKRTASAPCASISSIGSMPVPSDLLIRRPSGPG